MFFTCANTRRSLTLHLRRHQPVTPSSATSRFSPVSLYNRTRRWLHHNFQHFPRHRSCIFCRFFIFCKRNNASLHCASLILLSFEAISALQPVLSSRVGRTLLISHFPFYSCMHVLFNLHFYVSFVQFLTLKESSMQSGQICRNPNLFASKDYGILDNVCSTPRFGLKLGV